MPYPNSNSPITIKLSQLFSDLPAGLENDLKSSTPSADLAVAYGVISATDAAAHTHIADWPSDQQLLLRAELAQLVQSGTPVTFNWELAKKTKWGLISFPGGGVGVTFRSPLVYPPYVGP